MRFPKSPAKPSAAKNCSVPRFAPVTHREDYDFFAIVAIESHVSAAAELDDPLAELYRKLFDRAADLGVLGENLDTLTDGFDGSFGGVAVFGRKKGVESGHVAEGGLGPLQTWQRGASASSPASSFASHASASSAVACRPVVR